MYMSNNEIPGVHGKIVKELRNSESCELRYRYSSGSLAVSPSSYQQGMERCACKKDYGNTLTDNDDDEDDDQWSPV